MNPGPVDEAGKVAVGVVDALKQQPITLAMVLFNMVLLFVVYFGIKNMREHQSKMMDSIFEHMDRIYVCGKQQGQYRLQSDEEKPVEVK